MTKVRAAVALLILMVLPSVAGAAEKRMALVIGNQAYNNAVGPLANPHKDIAVVGKALTEVGFTVLAPRKDATRDECCSPCTSWLRSCARPVAMR